MQNRARKRRKAIYSVDESLKAKLPAKDTVDTLEAEIAYCQQLIEVTQTQLGIAQVPKITEPLLLQETVEDDVEQLRISEDQDARVGQ